MNYVRFKFVLSAAEPTQICVHLHTFHKIFDYALLLNCIRSLNVPVCFFFVCFFRNTHYIEHKSLIILNGYAYKGPI